MTCKHDGRIVLKLINGYLVGTCEKCGMRILDTTPKELDVTDKKGFGDVNVN